MNAIQFSANAKKRVTVLGCLEPGKRKNVYTCSIMTILFDLRLVGSTDAESIVVE